MGRDDRPSTTDIHGWEGCRLQRCMEPRWAAFGDKERTNRNAMADAGRARTAHLFDGQGDRACECGLEPGWQAPGYERFHCESVGDPDWPQKAGILDEGGLRLLRRLESRGDPRCYSRPGR